MTWFTYDGAGRLIAVTNALTNVTRYQYDEAGNQTNQIDALNRTNAYNYDGLGWRIQHFMPGGQGEGFTYDLAGNWIFHTNFNGVVLTNQYDALNRLTNRSSAGGYQIGYTYTPTGQRATITPEVRKLTVTGITCGRLTIFSFMHGSKANPLQYALT